MKKLVNLVWSITCLFLDLERDFNTENLLGLTEKPALDETEATYVVVKETKPLNVEPMSHEKLVNNYMSKQSAL